MRLRTLTLACLAVLLPATLRAQSDSAPVYTRVDSLRGGLASPGRAWWDVTYYDLNVAISPADSTIRGWNGITYRVLRPGRELQVDLMAPLVIDSVVGRGGALPVRQEGNAWFVTPAAGARVGGLQSIKVYYHGAPRIAARPPWSGGFTWTRDSLGRPWIVTTDQGIGASIWWPNKDTQADEPDSQRVALTVPAPLAHVGNGRLRSTTPNADGTITYEWIVVNPINNYAIAVAAGNYAHFSDTYSGERGTLTLDYWPLDYHLNEARAQFPQTRSMLACFERWFGPYPFYEDGFKLIEVPNNGMEHQSAVAYGNRYRNGYQGRDASGTGLGMQWDFIIVHEAAHEWWGNNITTQDLADMWVHESFANYAENLYTECLFGKEAGADYVVGVRRGIQNQRPIVPGAYGVNAQGSGDMYPKGGNMLHTIRQLVGNDERWRQILRGLNTVFRHRTVTGAQVQNYISTESGIDLTKVFQQYLTDIRIPVLETRVRGDSVDYRWAEVVPGFNMPVKVGFDDRSTRVLRPTEAWQTLAAPAGQGGTLTVDRNYYVNTRSVAP